MRVHRGSESFDPADRGCALTIGNFDGVHLGHRELLAAVVERARSLGRPAAAYTFDPHPRRVLRPEDCPPQITTWPQLEALLAAEGIDVLVREPFTRAFAERSPDSFLRDVIYERIAPSELFVGRDFHFGKGREGSDRTLVELGPGLGIRVVVIPQVRSGGEDVSSTRIRAALAGGDVERAGRLLGRPYEIWGRVAEGDRRGRTLGFPTANLEPENEIVPARGVYAGAVRLFDGEHPAGEALPAVSNVGTRPTFSDGRTVVEAHLLDWSGDLYGQRIGLAFVDRIRAERRFPDAEALKRQIASDAERARVLLRAAAG
jgi:riboflavin kinase/FMN adenylyltransferase